MSRLQRVLVPLSVAVGLTALAPASAMAASTVTFPTGQPTETTVSLTDVDHSSGTVRLTVTAATPANLANTKLLLGRGEYVYNVIGADGVREVEGDFRPMSGQTCAVAEATSRPDVPVTPVGNDTFTADLPKGDVISFEEADILAVVNAAPCTRGGEAGITVNFSEPSTQEVNGFDWIAPAAPAITATGGRRQVTLDFTQEAGTVYEVRRMANGTVVNPGGDADLYFNGAVGAEPIVIDRDAADDPLLPGTAYAFQVRAVRSFNFSDDSELASVPVVVSATTNAAQTVTFLAKPEGSTTSRTAVLTWSVTGDEAPYCWLDENTTPGAQMSGGTEVPCTATGATLSGLSLGSHTLAVYPADGEARYTATWTVVDAPTAPVPPTVPTPPTAPKPNPNDVDGDGIENTWLVGGKPAAAPKTPKLSVSGTRVKLTLATAPKGAKSIRVYRADGKGAYKLVKTVKAGSKSFTDTKVKAGKTYKYKTVAVNAKGQQGKASGTATAKIKKKK